MGRSQSMTNKVMTWVFIMALLISQSYAYAFVPCESNAHASSQHIDDMGLQILAQMDHSLLESDMSNHMQHNMKQNTQQQDMDMECCDQECSCLTGTCASVTLTHFITATALNVVSDPSGFYLFSIQDAFLPSLRKPPIIG
jgi:recombination DNA repair RAD52 pathway protein